MSVGDLSVFCCWNFVFFLLFGRDDMNLPPLALPAVYGLAALWCLVQSNLVLRGWLDAFNREYSQDGADRFTGVWIIDMLLELFESATGNYASVRVYDSVVSAEVWWRECGVVFLVLGFYCAGGSHLSFGVFGFWSAFRLCLWVIGGVLGYVCLRKC